MRRDLNYIKNNHFDALIIGGGIHGATLVYELAKSGLKVCLIEKEDFGSKTSANSLKVLHGGLRYLQHGNIKRIRESIYSRKVFQQIAPHLVKNVPFLIPTFGLGIKSKIAMRIALAAYDVLSFDRNSNISIECKLPPGKIISRNEIYNIIPTNSIKAATGGAVWYETIATSTERLLFEFLLKSVNHDASLANYVKAEKYLFNDNFIDSVLVKDKLSGHKFSINADIVINTVGPWLNEILSGTEDLKKLRTPLAMAVNIIVKKNFFREYAVGLESVKEFNDKASLINKGKRLFFFVPLNNYTMIGTTYKNYNKNLDNLRISTKDIEEIITEVNSIDKKFNIKLEDVSQTHIGVQATPNIEFENEFDVQPETHSLIFNHSTEGKIKNLISVKSVKYTTAPSIAKSLCRMLLQRKNISNEIDYSENNLFNKRKFMEQNKNIEEKLLSRLWNSYGHNAHTVLKYILKDKNSKKYIFENEKITFGEINYCMEREMAITSSDILDRRIGLSALEKINDEYYSKLDQLIENKIKK